MTHYEVAPLDSFKILKHREGRVNRDLNLCYDQIFEESV